MHTNQHEWWRWLLNRKIAEYVSSPTEDQDRQLRFLLTSYRALSGQSEVSEQETESTYRIANAS